MKVKGAKIHLLWKIHKNTYYFRCWYGKHLPFPLGLYYPNKYEKELIESEKPWFYFKDFIEFMDVVYFFPQQIYLTNRNINSFNFFFLWFLRRRQTFKIKILIKIKLFFKGWGGVWILGMLGRIHFSFLEPIYPTGDCTTDRIPICPAQWVRRNRQWHNSRDICI